MHLQGIIMVVILIILDWMFVLMNNDYHDSQQARLIEALAILQTLNLGKIFRICQFHDIHVQGLYPFPETNFPDFSRTFPGLRLIFQESKIHMNPFTPKISMLILLTVCHTFYIFNSSLTDFQNFPGPVAFFHHFPVLGQGWK